MTYISELDRVYQSGDATEHSYRPALQRLLSDMITAEGIDNTQVTNEPRRIECGSPDYIVTRNGIPVGYIEAKIINTDLSWKSDKANKEQFERYRAALENIVFTDYLDFHFYRNGVLTERVRIGEVRDNKIVPIKENFDRFNTLITAFCRAMAQSIKSADDLARIMAARARLMAGVIENSLSDGAESGMLARQMAVFKMTLIRDITPKTFADAYSQTIAYGMFAARLHDKTPATFHRGKVAELIPRTSPFLRNLFDAVAGINIDNRIKWIVDDLAEVFKVTDMDTVMADIGSDTHDDPMIHFYENFLTAYDPALRKSRGVWYTPHSTVSFIVRAVDELLQSELGLKDGLADETKITIDRKRSEPNANGQFENHKVEVHKVQILDPAAGTGTFLSETVSLIYDKFKKRGDAGRWQDYVSEHLIPRLNGFELLVAPYSMAHIKLDWMLSQTGYKPNDDERLRIYLTNSLEEQCATQTVMFEQFLALEAEEANAIKRDAPVMVVMGNPPYSGISQNNNPWISGMLDDYKRVDGVPLNERKHWLNDDYVKFIRLGQDYVSKRDEGILAYVNNHGFIDNPTFRGMRWNLMKAFDKIYIIDLHGNSKKKEVCPDGSKDENVFDIQQGVSINIFVKTGRKLKNKPAKVYHFDLYGRREEKYAYLRKTKLSKVPFTRVKPSAPFYFFVPKSDENKEEYENGFAISELFLQHNVGVVTGNDNLNVSFTKKEQINKIKDLIKLDERSWRDKYCRKADSTSWQYLSAKEEACDIDDTKLTRMLYRPFDNRWTCYTGKSGGLHSRPIFQTMRHFLGGENLGLISMRRSRNPLFWNCVFVSDCLVSGATAISALDINYVFPLYLYSKDDAILTSENRTPNLNESIVGELSKRLGLQFTPEKGAKRNAFAPIDILGYIYAVLHSWTYREKYKVFLKTDFPRIPYPESAEQFHRLIKLGGKLRRLHLLDGVKSKRGLANYPVPGSGEVDHPRFSDGKVYINSTQYFDNVPVEAWEFYIGGYQPAQKWLKDRKGRKLDVDEVEHYQRIIFVLRETINIMAEIG